MCFLGQNGRVSEGPSLKDVQSKAELNKVVGSGAAVSVHFWASWCEASKPMDDFFSHLSTDFPHAHFLRVRFFHFQPSIKFSSIIGLNILDSFGLVIHVQTE